MGTSIRSRVLDEQERGKVRGHDVALRRHLPGNLLCFAITG
jgi:hypothetical protein